MDWSPIQHTDPKPALSIHLVSAVQGELTPLSPLSITTQTEPCSPGPATARLPPTPRPDPEAVSPEAAVGPDPLSCPGCGAAAPRHPRALLRAARAPLRPHQGVPPGPATRGAHSPGRDRRRGGRASD